MLRIANIALAGMNAAQSRLAASAQNIVNATTPGFEPFEIHLNSTPYGTAAKPGGSKGSIIPSARQSSGRIAVNNKVNLEAELVDFKMAETSYKASLAVLKRADELQESLLEIMT